MASHASSSSKAAPLETVEPTPMSEASSWVPPLALRLGPESQIPDHPGSVWDVPRPSNNYGRRPSSPSLSHQQYTYPPPPQDYMYSHDMYAHQQQQQQAGMTGMAIQPGSAVDASQLLTQCRFVLSEYQGLLARRRRASTASLNEIDARVRGQQAAVLHSLGELQIEVHDMVKEAKNHRWRKWLLGGVVYVALVLCPFCPILSLSSCPWLVLLLTVRVCVC